MSTSKDSQIKTTYGNTVEIQHKIQVYSDAAKDYAQTSSYPI